jgi:hypothetical protein
MDRPFIFQCPATGLHVQHIFDDATPGGEDDQVYVGAVFSLFGHPSGKPHDRPFSCGHGKRVAKRSAHTPDLRHNLNTEPLPS